VEKTTQNLGDCVNTWKAVDCSMMEMEDFEMENVFQFQQTEGGGSS
jgi:hypothetical protein